MYHRLPPTSDHLKPEYTPAHHLVAKPLLLDCTNQSYCNSDSVRTHNIFSKNKRPLVAINMRGSTIFLLASLALPIIATPVPTNHVDAREDAVERRSAFSIPQLYRDLFKREPLIEALPKQALYDVADKTKRIASEDSIEVGDDGEGAEVADKRAVYIPGGGVTSRDRPGMNVGGGGPTKRDALRNAPGGPGKRMAEKVRPGGPGKREAMKVRPGGPGRREAMKVRPGGPGKRDAMKVRPGGPGRRDAMKVRPGGPGR